MIIPSETPNLMSKIAFGSCSHQDKLQPIWETIRSWNPDIFLHLGDVVYSDARSVEYMKSCFDQMANKPEFQKFCENIPILGTWDDHDYGDNDAGAENPLRDQIKEIFLNFYNEPRDSIRRKRKGIYITKTFGPLDKRIQLIMLDTRYFRGPWKEDSSPNKRYQQNTDPDINFLGNEQWAWLEDQLKQPAQVRIIATGLQVVSEHDYECWYNLPLERERLFNLIKNTKASGVMFISGDRHFAEISCMDAGVGYPVYDFTSSGLTELSVDGHKSPNPLRVGNIFGGENNFGTININWDKIDPLLTLQAHDLQGNVHISLQIQLSELSP